MVTHISYFLTWRQVKEERICMDFFKGNPNFQGILNWILQILLCHYSKQHKNIKNLQFLEQNSFTLSALLCVYCDLYFLRFSLERYFSVLGKILNATSDHSCWCIRNLVYNSYILRYFVSSITESLYKSFSC